MGPNGAPYVTYLQLSQYVPAAVLGNATIAQQQQACLDASEQADSLAFRGRYTLPLLVWGADVTRYTAYIAIYLLVAGPIGFASTSGSDSNIKTNYYEAVGWPDRPGSGWFVGVGRTLINPDVTPSQAVGSDPTHDVPRVQSLPLRCWQTSNRVGGF